PSEEEALRSLPGIGPYTAAAIRAFAFDLPAVVIDTNIRRIYIHFFFPEGESVHDRDIAPLVEETMDPASPREWYYALMDYGAVLAKWFPNPNRRSAHYAKQGPFENSNRQIRGKVLRWLTAHGSLEVAEGPRRLEVEAERLGEVVEDLAKEGFLRREGGRLALP
ncbi:MAG: A/G-specific adenine glycosylase, partial [Spirochaetota bacterium]